MTVEGSQAPLDVDVFALAALGMVITDRGGRFRRVNPAFAELLGRTPEDLVGVTFSSLTSPDDVGRSQQVMRDLVERRCTTARFEKRYVRADGALIWVDMNIRSLLGPDGEVAGFLTQGVDITGRKAAEEVLTEHALLFDSISDAVFISGPDGRLKDCNVAAERLTGRSRAELILGAGDARWEQWRERMCGAMAVGGWAGDVTFRQGEPGERVTETVIVPVDGAEGVVAAIAVCRDVTGARASEEALADAARQARHGELHDTLTGLPNRRLLAERYADDQRGGVGLALLMIDLDRFKEVNDTLGHTSGDDLLVQVARRIQDAVREGDTVARLGGDEFAVLLPGVASTEEAVALADRVRMALESPFALAGIELDVEASIGVAVADPDLDVGTALRHADVAMYIAKGQHLGVVPYDPSADEHSAARLGLLAEVRRGISRREFVLYYQPKIELGTGAVVGAEALLRWQHPTRGLLAPAEFLPLAERTGLIGSLTRYVLDWALTQVRHWSDEGRPLPVAVNLSARNLQEEGLVERIFGLLTRHGVPPALLELEITESTIIGDVVKARDVIARLRDAGLKVSIDDFGTGFTSLAELRNLPVNELKVDRSFVEALVRRTSDAMIVRSVIELSHDLGLTAVAEGVEDVEVLAALAALGCDVVQGYHMSRPLPAGQFGRWLDAWNAGDFVGSVPAPPLPPRQRGGPPATVAGVPSVTDPGVS